jgi:hypothetical protein
MQRLTQITSGNVYRIGERCEAENEEKYLIASDVWRQEKEREYSEQFYIAHTESTEK